MAFVSSSVIPFPTSAAAVPIKSDTIYLGPPRTKTGEVGNALVIRRGHDTHLIPNPSKQQIEDYEERQVSVRLVSAIVNSHPKPQPARPIFRPTKLREADKKAASQPARTAATPQAIERTPITDLMERYGPFIPCSAITEEAWFGDRLLYAAAVVVIHGEYRAHRYQGNTIGFVCSNQALARHIPHASGWHTRFTGTHAKGTLVEALLYRAYRAEGFDAVLRAVRYLVAGSLKREELEIAGTITDDRPWVPESSLRG